jgi:hypothetical protein
LRGILQHLEEYGYVTREQVRDDWGRMAATVYTVFEQAWSACWGMGVR